MGRKRCSSYVESSDDEFQLSDVESSPMFSRLKRPKRAHNNKPSAASPSPERNSAQLEEDVNCSIVIPDSLERDENSIPESIAESVPRSPKDPRDEDTRETEAPSERAADIEETKDVDDHDDHVEVIEEEDDSKDIPQSPNNVKLNNTTTPGRRRNTRTVYQIVSDSEEEPERDNDDDDAYNSAEDSPPEEDDDSEFDFSPQKPAKKKEKPSAKRAPGRQKAQTSATRKLATRKLATRKHATKPALASPKTTAPGKSRANLKSTTGGAKRSLGARLPRRGLMPVKSSGSDKNHPQSLGKLPSAPTIRSGLSRKAVIPRLHAYLPR